MRVSKATGPTFLHKALTGQEHGQDEGAGSLHNPLGVKTSLKTAATRGLALALSL